ncbi:retrotransposon protein, putative, ty1-copia subclass [Tanacetum coccineum]
MTINQITSNSIKSILEKEKLNGSNFLDWYRNMRIVLRYEQKLNHLEEAISKAPPATATVVVHNAYTRRIMVLFSVSKDNLFYFNAISRDGIFEIDMHNHVSNEHSIYTCNNKKSKRNLGSTFLWHCHLGHINKKRITKLQHDGLLKLIDDESFDVCISCIFGKMARNPFTHAGERANKQLGLIYSDVCGPFRATLTTLPMYFWGYALESDAHILNMVPTKKVDKTPYEK